MPASCPAPSRPESSNQWLSVFTNGVNHSRGGISCRMTRLMPFAFQLSTHSWHTAMESRYTRLLGLSRRRALCRTAQAVLEGAVHSCPSSPCWMVRICPPKTRLGASWGGCSGERTGTRHGRMYKLSGLPWQGSRGAGRESRWAGGRRDRGGEDGCVTRE